LKLSSQREMSEWKFGQREKQEGDVMSADDGMNIDLSDEQLRIADSPSGDTQQRHSNLAGSIVFNIDLDETQLQVVQWCSKTQQVDDIPSNQRPIVHSSRVKSPTDKEKLVCWTGKTCAIPERGIDGPLRRKTDQCQSEIPKKASTFKLNNRKIPGSSEAKCRDELKR
jgi:hypothetical protein